MSNSDPYQEPARLAARGEIDSHHLLQRLGKLEQDVYGLDDVGAVADGLKDNVIRLMHDVYAPDNGLKPTVERHVLYWRDQSKTNRDVMIIGAVLVSVSLVNLIIAILVLVRVY